MALEGLHHVTAITADAQRNLDFYAGVLGLRFVKKTVNFDAPDVYHLYFGDEVGTPGSILTFFEFPGARPGRAGAGMVHRILWRVGSPEALAFWQERLGIDGTVFTDPEGLEHELVVADVEDRPLVAAAADIPAEHALQGFHGVRAYAPAPERSRELLQALAFADRGDGLWELRGDERGATLHLDAPPAQPGVQSAGTVHHVAWSAADDGELALVARAAQAAGARPTPIIDRQYFHSVYFREPNGVLFELASRDIGFDADEPRETLGQALKLPPQHEPLRDRLERTLTPLRDPPHRRELAGRAMSGAADRSAAGLDHRVRPAAGDPEGALVLLHGRGADEHDLFGLLDLLDPDRRLLGLTAGGPFALPPGGKHWYVVPRVGFPDPDTFAASFARLSGFLDATGVPADRTVLGGFSQGAVMSWALALEADRPAPAGVIALSGFVPTVPGWAFPGRPIRAAIGHGTMDPVIGIDFGREARDRMAAAGADVTYHESPIGHQIDPRFLATLPGWLEETLRS